MPSWSSIVVAFRYGVRTLCIVQGWQSADRERAAPNVVLRHTTMSRAALVKIERVAILDPPVYMNI
jgi:hypothetical protein